MMKSKKIIMGISIGLLMTGVVTTATIMPLMINQNTISKTNIMTKMNNEDWNQNKPFQFNNKVYLNINDAYNDLITQIGGINIEQYIGQINNKNEDGSIILNNNPIKKFEPSKISNAYMDANGRYTNNYDEALESFINASNLVTQYYDYKGNYFLDEEDAKYSMDNFKSMGFSYYKIIDYKGIEHKINPLNSQDINKLKEIALEWIINYPNQSNNPFKLKIVSKSLDDKKNEIYEKINEIDYRIINEWNNFYQDVFLKNLYSFFANEILNILNNYDYIKAKIYLKPYILDPKKDQKDVLYNQSFHTNWNEDNRFAYKFANSTSIIETKEINLVELYEIINTFFNREEFLKKYTIKKERLNLTAVNGPSCEGAYYIKDGNVDFFSNFVGNSYQSITKNMDAIRPNTMHYNNDIITVSILGKSSEAFPHNGDIGPDYKNNYTITFGIDAWISDSSSFSKILEDKINDHKLIEEKFWDSVNEIKNNKDYKLLNIFFNKFSNENLLIDIDIKKDEEENKDENSMNMIAKNLFNQFVIDGIASNKLPQLDKHVHSKLTTNTLDRSDDNQFTYSNYSIDMHQWSYFVNHSEQEEIYKNGKNIWLGSNDDYLGLKAISEKYLDSSSSEKILNKFYSINNKLNISFANKSSNNFAQLINDFDYFIMYNNLPLFKVSEDYDDVTCKNFSLLVNSGFNLKNNNILDIDYKNISNLLQNVSTSYNIKGESKNFNNSNVMTDEYVCNNLNNIYYGTNSELQLKIRNFDQNSIKPTWNYLPSNNDEPNLMGNGIYDSISLYNQNIKNLNSNHTNLDILEKNKPKDFLMLFDKFQNNIVTPKELYYGETIMGVDNINLSLTSSNTNNLVAYNYKQLENIEKRLKVFSSPAKVYFIYSGANLINTKPVSQYDENGKINPDYFDSPELIIENSLRTYWLKPDKQYLMYSNNEGIYEPILNNKFILYSFKINDRWYYFDKISDTKNKIIDIIKYNSFKI